MKVLTVAHVIETDVTCEPGQELDLREEVALDLIERGLALEIKEPETEKPETASEKKPKGNVERAVAGQRETAVGPGQKK